MQDFSMRQQQQNSKPGGWRSRTAVITFWAIFLALLLFLQAVFINKGSPNTVGWVMADRMSEYNSAAPIAGFYAVPKDSLDVVFIGSSVSFCGVNPNVIFHEYGYSSYVFGTGLIGLSTAICFLEEALRTQHPEAVVIDTTSFAPFYAENPNTGYESSIWYMPFSAAKCRFAARLGSFDDGAAVLLPLYKFHSRWKSVRARDVRYLFSDKNDYMLGFCGRETVSKDDAFAIYDSLPVDDARFDAVEPNVQAFVAQANELCTRAGTRLVFVASPSMNARNPAVYPFFNTLSDYLAKQNIPFINYLYEKDRLQLTEADIADELHLTTSGAKKFSLVMGGDMQRLLTLPDGRGTPAYAYYADCYEKYVALVKSIPNWEALNAF